MGAGAGFCCGLLVLLLLLLLRWVYVATSPFLFHGLWSIKTELQSGVTESALTDLTGWQVFSQKESSDLFPRCGDFLSPGTLTDVSCSVALVCVTCLMCLFVWGLGFGTVVLVLVLVWKC